jgi:NADH-quinone oxidoreductase subunit L
VSLQLYAWLVLAFPLVGTVVIALGWRSLPGRSAGWIGTGAIALAFLASVGALFGLLARPHDERQVTSALYDYAATAGVDAQVSILIDPLSVFMALVVSGVSALIHLYSVAYMASDRGYARFFSYLNYFVFSMLLLVLGGNFMMLIIGWAFVGAASYLLISFWYRRTTATYAGIKAFVMNVIGDAGLVLGTYFIFKHVGTLDFLKTFEAVPKEFSSNQGDLVAGCLLILLGGVAKSAQIPLHTWLPDAMEGPTPVSALIHAATMVTAGVYLIARMHPLFEQAPAAADVGAILGCATLIVAATIGLAVTDLKRVIAYSTMSQIGYMIMGVSAGAYAAGLFHLYTHAFFKALLFMAAGSVIAAMAGVQSLDRMGGFRRPMPFTFGCFIVGGLALAGVPPFAGFFSKDEILLLVGERGGWHWVLYVIGYIGAFITAIYTFRMIFRAFLRRPVREARELTRGHQYHAPVPVNPMTGEEEDTDVGFPGPEHHIAERSRPMAVAMAVLATGAAVGGLVQIPHVTHVIDSFLEPTFEASKLYHREIPTDLTVFGLALGTVLGLAGIAVAWVVWVRRPEIAPRVRERLAAVHQLFVNKWYFDELYEAAFVRPAAAVGRFAQATFERVFVDRTLVGGATGLVRAGSAAVRAAQTGLLRYYAALLVVGVTGVAFYFLIVST